MCGTVSVRSKDGSFTIFDAPGAGTAAGQGTRAYATTRVGRITGHFTDSVNVAHGYVRSNQGVITVFDAPGAGTGPGQGTFPFNSPHLINPNGAITGYYVDSAFVSHGFLRDKNGVITTFDAPGAGTGARPGYAKLRNQPRWRSQDSTLTRPTRFTVSCGIRMASSPHSMFRARAPAHGQGTYGGGFTPNGTIMGVLIDANNVNHGFLLDKNGAVTTFDAPDAGTGSDQGTYPWGINTNGAITGWYVDEANVSHGFVRDKHGAIVEFDVPGAGTGPFQGPPSTALLRTARWLDITSTRTTWFTASCEKRADTNSWPTDAATP